MRARLRSAAFIAAAFAIVALNPISSTGASTVVAGIDGPSTVQFRVPNYTPDPLAGELDGAMVGVGVEPAPQLERFTEVVSVAAFDEPTSEEDAAPFSLIDLLQPHLDDDEAVGLGDPELTVDPDLTAPADHDPETRDLDTEVSSEPASDEDPPVEVTDPPVEVTAPPTQIATPPATSPDGEHADPATDQPAVDTQQLAQQVVVAGQTHSIVEQDSLLVLVNKRHPLDKEYRPDDLVAPKVSRGGGNYKLRAEAAVALEAMSAAAKDEVGEPLELVSGFRSYATQRKIYKLYVAKYGEEIADTFSARPGFSEHQTGWAADLAEVGGKFTAFGDSELGAWTAANSWRFGFILRFVESNLNITGYQAEPWHFRYVGKDIAAYYHDHGFNSVEELVGAFPAPSYE